MQKFPLQDMEEDRFSPWQTKTEEGHQIGPTRHSEFEVADQLKWASEPMDIAMRLLKDRKSPEAFQHKKEYDTEYESSPERIKYREELNRERRKRGMYGDHSHRDISHTQGNKLSIEDEHSNRARHFKDRGTLRNA